MLLPVLIAIPLLIVAVLALVDLVRRPDLSTSSKAGWAVLIVVLPVAGALIYLVARPDQPGDRFETPGGMPHETAPGRQGTGTRYPH
jgi:hypothetical protein